MICFDVHVYVTPSELEKVLFMLFFNNIVAYVDYSAGKIDLNPSWSVIVY